jgi:CRISPR-associated protein Csb2
VSETDEYRVRSKTWVSVRPYTVTRHRKGVSAAEALAEDLLAECSRRGLPRPAVSVLDARGVSGRGLEGYVRLDFDVAVEGPIVLGRTRYLGGGLFAHASPRQPPTG